MGRDISSSTFTREDEQRFRHRLAEETRLLRRWREERRFRDCPTTGGLELEAWLVDAEGRPAPCNAEFLGSLDDPAAVPEIGAFNVEFNGPPRELRNGAIQSFHTDLEQHWRAAAEHAERHDLGLVMIGILPSLGPEHLHLDQMTDAPRYRALNDRILSLRRGVPLRVRVDGEVPFERVERNVMLEAGLTSFQVHLQTPPDRIERVYNAGIVAAAPLVAATCNAPFLFGEPLWQESRIPIFEQVFRPEAGVPRVSLGRGYVQDSLVELFERNLADHVPLLPANFDTRPEELEHLKLHNGTIWRWVRPVIEVGDGGPALRVEHRVIPSGPTLADATANAVLTWGLMLWLAHCEDPPERRLSFADAQRNLVAAARHGLDARLRWIDGRDHRAREIVLHHLPDVRRALRDLDLDRHELRYYLGIVERRLRSGRTGARWQRAWREHHGGDGAALTRAYLARQRSGLSVDRWAL